MSKLGPVTGLVLPLWMCVTAHFLTDIGVPGIRVKESEPVVLQLFLDGKNASSFDSLDLALRGLWSGSRDRCDPDRNTKF